MSDSRTISDFCDTIVFISFCLLIFLLPFSSGAVQFFSCFIILVFGVRLLFKRSDIRFSSDLLNIIMLSFILFCVVSIFVNPYPVLGWKGLFRKVLPGVALFYIFIGTMADEKRIRWFLASAITGVLIVCLAGLWQYAFGEDFIRHKPLFHGRIQSTMKAPTDFAAYLGAFLPFLLMSGWGRRSSGPSRFAGFSGEKSWIIFLIVFMLAVPCFALTYSRGGWLIFSMAMMLLAVVDKRVRWPVLIGLILFWTFFPQKMLAEREHMSFNLLLSLFGRDTFWTEAWHLIRSHWLFGSGLNAYSEAVQPYNIGWGHDPHNCYLQMWAEIGILGLLSFLAAQLTIISAAVKAFFKERDQFKKNTLISLVLGFSGFLFHSSLDTFLYSASLGIFLWLMMALVVVLTRLSSVPSK